MRKRKEETEKEHNKRYCRNTEGDRRGDGRSDGGGDGSGGCCDGGGSDSSSGHSCVCCCCDMNGLGIIDGMRMTRYRMTTSSGTGTVGISRGNPSSPSPGTSNCCKPYTSHYRTDFVLRASCAGYDRYDTDNVPIVLLNT
ncbi:hypothetical protein PUN28_005373 [Cardiocondyla obscurior]|uniref:Uncharacterized protein n=1 Tax=Cardiocondyla obscurior TaxID=286306 RepID=A0AAW2GG66_9HYME